VSTIRRKRSRARSRSGGPGDYLNVTKKEAQQAALAKMVDELGDLEQELEPYKPKFARIDQLRAAIRGVYARADPGRSYQPAGERWMVLLGKQGNLSLVDKPQLLKLVGAAKFADIATISLKALEEKCTPDVLGAVVSLEQIGPRMITIVPAPAAAEE